MTDPRHQRARAPFRGLLLAAAWLLAGGCASVVPRGEPVTLTDGERAALRAFPERPYEMEQSVVFALRGRNFPGFGITRISPREGRFASSCLTAQGMTVFDVAGQGDRLDVCRALPGVGDPRAAGQAFAQTIRSVYFDNQPGPQAAWRRDGDSWVAQSPLQDGGALRHRFTCADGRLAEKCQFSRRGRLARSIAYQDYDETGPRRIELSDRTLRWPYALTIRIKTWRGEGVP